MNRREFLKITGSFSVLAAVGMPVFFSCSREQPENRFLAPKLPYREDALEPHLSNQMVYIHYGKFHLGYAEKLQRGISGTEYEGMPLAEMIRKTAHKKEALPIFQPAAQLYNHTFYWLSMKPGGGGKPGGGVGDAVDSEFGGYDKFAAEFIREAGSLFGSGWAWLVKEGGKLKIVVTRNADTPVAGDTKPILALDLWEHAYYLDYQNQRDRYAAVFLKHLANWDFAEANWRAA